MSLQQNQQENKQLRIVSGDLTFPLSILVVERVLIAEAWIMALADGIVWTYAAG